jgi:flagellar biosynthesis/type III secretory pathway protein FliH
VIRCADWIIDPGPDGVIRAAGSGRWAPLKRGQSIPPVIRADTSNKYYSSNQMISPGDKTSMIRAYKSDGNIQGDYIMIIIESRQTTSHLHKQNSHVAALSSQIIRSGCSAFKQGVRAGFQEGLNQANHNETIKEITLGPAFTTQPRMQPLKQQRSIANVHTARSYQPSPQASLPRWITIKN